MQSRNVVDAIKLILSTLARVKPYIYAFIAPFEIYVVNDPRVPTASTDGIRIFVSEEFAKKLLEDEKEGYARLTTLLLHEAMHAIAMHPERARRLLEEGANPNIVAVVADGKVDVMLREVWGRGNDHPSPAGITVEKLEEILVELGFPRDKASVAARKWSMERIVQELMERVKRLQGAGQQSQGGGASGRQAQSSGCPCRRGSQQGGQHGGQRQGGQNAAAGMDGGKASATRGDGGVATRSRASQAGSHGGNSGQKHGEAGGEQGGSESVGQGKGGGGPQGQRQGGNQRGGGQGKAGGKHGSQEAVGTMMGGGGCRGGGAAAPAGHGAQGGAGREAAGGGQHGVNSGGRGAGGGHGGVKQHGDGGKSVGQGKGGGGSGREERSGGEGGSVGGSRGFRAKAEHHSGRSGGAGQGSGPGKELLSTREGDEVAGRGRRVWEGRRELLEEVRRLVEEGRVEEAAEKLAREVSVLADVARRVYGYTDEARVAGTEGGDKPAGVGKGGLNRRIAELARGRVDWRRLLRDAMLSMNARDVRRTWSKMNRKLGPVRPGREIVGGIEEVFVAIDVSGSISPREYRRFAEVTLDAASAIKPRRMRIVWWDWGIQKEVTIRNPRPSSVKSVFEEGAPGGGGTSIAEALERLVEEAKRLRRRMLAVIASDWYTSEAPEAIIEKLIEARRRGAKIVVVAAPTSNTASFEKIAKHADMAVKLPPESPFERAGV